MTQTPSVGRSSTPSSHTDQFELWRQALVVDDPQILIKLLVEVARWTEQHPNAAHGWVLLGDIYLRVRQPYAAQRSFEKADAISPADARTLEGLGLAQLGMDNPIAALPFFERAHHEAPNNAEILVHWGLAHFMAGQLRTAHRLFRKATEAVPDNVQAWHNLGLVDLQRGKTTTALEHFCTSLRHDPDFAPAHYHAALAHRQLGQPAKAQIYASNAHRIAPNHFDHLLLLADLVLDAGRPEQADALLQKAIEVAPTAPESYLSLARMHTMCNDFEHARGVLKTALELHAPPSSIQLANSHIHLLQRDWESGWTEYETRKDVVPSPVRSFPLPQWNGEDLTGQTILVHAEQGLGATIMFAQCLPDLIARAAHVVVEVPTELASLVRRSFPAATVVGRHPRWETDMAWLDGFKPRIAWQTPIGSLPRFFRTKDSDFPNETQGYLQADPQRVAYWRMRLSENPRPSVGVAWSGGLPHSGRQYRSVPLSELSLNVHGLPVHWISLQHDEGSPDAQDTNGLTSWAMTRWPQTLQDFDDLAALTRALDMVVTVCSTQAHLAGALGCKGIVLVPSAPPWPYGLDTDKVIWHPSLSVIRQKTLNDWQPALQQLHALISTWEFENI